MTNLANHLIERAINKLYLEAVGVCGEPFARSVFDMHQLNTDETWPGKLERAQKLIENLKVQKRRNNL